MPNVDRDIHCRNVLLIARRDYVQINMTLVWLLGSKLNEKFRSPMKNLKEFKTKSKNKLSKKNQKEKIKGMK